VWEVFEPGSGRKSTRERLLCVISLQKWAQSCRQHHSLLKVIFPEKKCITRLGCYPTWLQPFLQTKQCVMYGDTCKCSVSKNSLFLGHQGPCFCSKWPFGACACLSIHDAIHCTIVSKKGTSTSHFRLFFINPVPSLKRRKLNNAQLATI